MYKLFMENGSGFVGNNLFICAYIVISNCFTFASSVFIFSKS